MSQGEYNLLHILHVAAALVLMGQTFYAFAAAPEARKRVLIVSGVAALVLFAAGIRLWQAVYGFAPAGWVFVKIGCWLGISALAGIGYRQRGRVCLLSWVAVALAVIAVVMAYAKPF